MYMPNEHLTDKGMTGAVKYYRERRGLHLAHNPYSLCDSCRTRIVTIRGIVTQEVRTIVV